VGQICPTDKMWELCKEAHFATRPRYWSYGLNEVLRDLLRLVKPVSQWRLEEGHHHLFRNPYLFTTYEGFYVLFDPAN
jgi:hypothetical protein